jgi:hypothetical protein
MMVIIFLLVGVWSTAAGHLARACVQKLVEPYQKLLVVELYMCLVCLVWSTCLIERMRCFGGSSGSSQQIQAFSGVCSVLHATDARDEQPALHAVLTAECICVGLLC